MKWAILIACAVFLFLAGRAKHIYKSECVPHNNKFGFMLGSVCSYMMEGAAWYGLFKCMSLI